MHMHTRCSCLINNWKHSIPRVFCLWHVYEFDFKHILFEFTWKGIGQAQAVLFGCGRLVVVVVGGEIHVGTSSIFSIVMVFH